MASLIQVTGAVVISIGVSLVFMPAGIMIAGILMVVFGLSLEKK